MAPSSGPDGRGDWELANWLFLPTDADVADRSDVAGEKSPPWVTEGDAIVLTYPPPDSSPLIRYKDFDVFVVFSVAGTGYGDPYTFGPQQGVWQWYRDYDPDKWVVAGIKVDRGFMWDNDDRPPKRFEALNPALQPLVRYNPAANDVASRRTFWNDESVIVGVGRWAEHWANEFRRYAAELKTDASAWEGSAAGQFAALLREFEKRLREVHREINPSGATSVPRGIGDAVLAMEKALNELVDGHNAFFADPYVYSPHYHLFTAMHKHYEGVSNVVRVESRNPVFTDEKYDPRSAVMRDAVEAAAKKSWLDQVVKVLDPVGKKVIADIRREYRDSAEVFASAKFTEEVRLVPPTSRGDGSGGGANSEVERLREQYEEEIEKLKDSYDEAIDKLIDKYDKIIENLEQDLRDQQDEFKEILAQNRDDNRDAMKSMEDEYQRIITDLQDDMRAQKENYDEVLKNAGADNRDAITDLKNEYERIIDGLKDDLTSQKEDYESLLRGGDPNSPATLLPASLLQTQFRGLGDERDPPPLRDQLNYPPGTVLDPAGRPMLHSDGTPVVLPPGSRIAPDGTVLGPDGQPVRDTDGSPVVLPPGSSISDGGRTTNPQLGRYEPPAGSDNPPSDWQTQFDLARDRDPMWLTPDSDGGLDLIGRDGTRQDLDGLRLEPNGSGGYDLVTDGGTRTPLTGFDLTPDSTQGVRLLPNADGGIDLVAPDGTRRTIDGVRLEPDGNGGYDLVTDGGSRTSLDELRGVDRSIPDLIDPSRPGTRDGVVQRPDLVGGRDDFGLDPPDSRPGTLLPPAVPGDLVDGIPRQVPVPVGGTYQPPDLGDLGDRRLPPGQLLPRGGIGEGVDPGGVDVSRSVDTRDAALTGGLTPQSTGESGYPPYVPPPAGGGAGGGGQDQPRNRTPYPLREEIDQARSRAARRKQGEPRGLPWDLTDGNDDEPPVTPDTILDVLAGAPNRNRPTPQPVRDAQSNLPVGDARESGVAAPKVPTVEDTIRGEDNTWGADTAPGGTDGGR
ncbi:hypothetical protein O7632_18030 [Solwaraspora sp. WMMD406]|uniref:hypothetical protein n=1 Tax=Solwaraspora sp. WMMD406 TaxID=3016095 RepID=UPI0024165E60|nr:hypothetical protein [Solwaraspora sp. WMMD406]MDG4765985.1 hypothetical protein [Solwaraspora sp. WMMD406]